MKGSLLALFSFTLGVATSSAASFGVAGHSSQPAFPVYQSLSAAQQLDKVKELGVTYYRVDATDVWEIKALVDAVRAPGSPYANIKIIPIIYSWFTTDDLKTNPNGYSNSYFYNTCKQRGKDFASWWINSGYGMPFEAIEIGNEMDLICIKDGEDGKDLTDYHDEGGFQANTIQGSYWRCQAVIDGLADGIRQAHPTVKRLIGCAGWYHYGFIDKLLIDCGNANWEGVVYHWYSEMGLISQQPAVTSKLQSYGKPVWITEVNNRNGSLQLPGETVAQAEQRQADGLGAQVNDLKTLSFVTAIFPYELFDEPNLASQAPNESRYGFYRIGGSPGSYYISGRKDVVFNAFQAAKAPGLGGGNYRLSNRWTGYFMHIENLTGKVQYGAIAAGAWSSHWTLVKNGEGYYTIQSRWTGAYLHIENQLGYVQYDPYMSGAWSAQWSFVKNSDGYYTIVNRWTGAKMHTENQLGYVQYGSIPDNYSSVQWALTAAP
ncbi:MAG: RICIN domain-containing protein [Verrucomicrobiales bacterium]|nr:RICIN domain-containing protein [Verrucomicrobiales bacterium]